jgi:hypothetical protein
LSEAAEQKLNDPDLNLSHKKHKMALPGSDEFSVRPSAPRELRRPLDFLFFVAKNFPV